VILVEKAGLIPHPLDGKDTAMYGKFTNVNKLRRGSTVDVKGKPILPYNKPLLTLLPLAPKVFASQKRFFATPTCFFKHTTP
jgi:hypothetical protein